MKNQLNCWPDSDARMGNGHTTNCHRSGTGPGLLLAGCCVVLTGLAWSIRAVEVVAWGGNFDSQLEVPPSATNVVAVYAGGFHGVALRGDGTVVVWGNIPKDGGMLPGGDLRPPAGLSNVVTVAAGDYFNVALKADGRLVAWGNNSFGQITGLEQLSNIVAVAAGHAHTLALRADGVLIAVGGNYDGQLDLPPELDDYVAVAAHLEFSLALRSDGTLVKAGHNLSPIPVEATNVVAISAGQYHALALRRDGAIIEWGYKNNDAVPRPDGLTNVVAIAAGAHHDLALLGDGHVLAWGANWLGQAEVPATPNPVSAIDAGYAHSLALIRGGPPRIFQQPRGLTGVIGGNGRLVVRANGTQPIHYQWRQNGSELAGATNAFLALDGLSMFDNGDYELVATNSYGAVTSQVATVSTATSPPFSLSINAEPTNRIAVLGGSAEFSAQAQGTPPFAYRWFFEDRQLSSPRESALRLGNLRFADAGNYRVAVANPFGLGTSAPVRLSVVNVAVWGARNVGSDPRVFDVLPSVTNVVTLSASQWAVLGLRYDRSAVGWGDPGSGRVPPSSDATNLTTVVAGGEFGLGLRVDGSVVTWGANPFGIQPLPAGLSNVIQLSAAYSWALALKADGTLIQWGTYIGGWMTPPPPLRNVVQISAGARHALGLLRDGTVVGWGSDDCGQVNPPAGLSNVVTVVAGNCYSMALREDGTVVEWGRETYSPPPDATNLVVIATGNFHRLGLREDGKVFSWGFENGNAGQTRVPTDLPPAVAIAAAGDASFAVVPATGEPHIARHPRRQKLSSGHQLRLETRLFPGSSNVTFQWFKDGTEVPGETGPLLVREFAAVSDSGRYRVFAHNSFGMESSREVEVLVVTQPPLINCPTNTVVNFSNSDGVVVNFAVTATGESGVPPTITCVPPSGSLFPIGQTTVTCAATDGDMSSNTCSFTVTVLGARGSKENVLANLIAIRATVTDRNDGRHLDAAIKHLTKSLIPRLWVDETHLERKQGGRAFYEEKLAARILCNLLQRHIPLPFFPHNFPAEADRLLATVAIEDAIKAGASNRKIEEAQRFLAKGDAAATDDKCYNSVEHYRNAWKRAAR